VILCGIARSFSAMIFIESDIQYPMQGVFDSPMRSDAGVDVGGIGIQTIRCNSVFPFRFSEWPCGNAVILS
jgi:hypothetical protein